MKNRKIGKFTAAGFVGLIVLVVLILLSNSLRRSSHIVLPDTIQPTEDSSTMESGAEGAITPIVVTPETVQAAIESLHRPANYRRSITVERLWSGGSGTSEITVSVSGGWTRTDARRSADPPYPHRRGDDLYLVREANQSLQLSRRRNFSG